MCWIEKKKSESRSFHSWQKVNHRVWYRILYKGNLQIAEQKAHKKSASVVSNKMMKLTNSHVHGISQIQHWNGYAWCSECRWDPSYAFYAINFAFAAIVVLRFFPPFFPFFRSKSFLWNFMERFCYVYHKFTSKIKPVCYTH